jgi:aspartyl-tRNA(Asn)/glutamyl-tRNA(Gln) amidotransferase subunit A
MSEQADLSFASIAEVSVRFRDGRLSPVDVAEHCLARIEALNPALNAFITVTAATAREQARDAERDLRAGRWRGPLHGVPVAVKDFYDTAGVRTTAGFEHFQNRVPTQDAEMVARLRDAGATVVGKTNMHKLGMGTTSLDSHFGPVVNPWSARHVAGGSSGGSAAAVAAGLCYATIDTDAIGSGRLPAAICGVCCLKPTFGVLSAAGILAGEKADPAILALGHPSVMARSAEDIALVLEALAGTKRGDAEKVRRVGVVSNFAADGQVRAAFKAAISVFATLGVEMRQVKAPFEAASFEVSGIAADRAAINASLFGNVDAIVLPTLSAPTPTVTDALARGEMAVSADNTFFCNYLGLPAISIPGGSDRNGLPLGVQIVGPQAGDAAVLVLAHDYQRATGWRYRPPQYTK